MLRLSKMADYGTVVMTALIGEPERSRSAAEIAAAIRVPAPTVSKILKMLARGGLVASLRGARGGYLLARPAHAISLADIIHAMDGPIGMTECSITPGLCSQEAACAVRANWQRVNHAVLGVLREISLEQMAMPLMQPVMQPVKQPAMQSVNAGAIKLNRGSKPASAGCGRKEEAAS